MSDDAVLEPIEPHVLRSAFACFPSGVTALCAMADGQPMGMAASSFTSVSLDPPLVSVCVAHTSTTWPVLHRAQRLGVSVLSDAHSQVARALSAKGADRFADVDWEDDETGAIFVHGSVLWLSCAVHASFPAGDHNVVLLRIVSPRSYPEVAPMVFHGSAFRSLAPTELSAWRWASGTTGRSFRVCLCAAWMCSAAIQRRGLVQAGLVMTAPHRGRGREVLDGGADWAARSLRH